MSDDKKPPINSVVSNKEVQKVENNPETIEITGNSIV